MEKLAVVTGGTKGIGRALVWKLAAEGWQIATCARDSDALKALQTAIEAATGNKIYVQSGNMGWRDDVDAFAEFVLRVGVPLGLLVNNAGQFVPGSLTEEDEGTLEQMMDTNLYSAYHLTRALIPTLYEQNEGLIVNIGSIAALEAYPPGASYSISKHALLGFSRALRHEAAQHNVGVTIINPGPVYTSSWAASGVEPEKLASAEDLAELIHSITLLSSRSVAEELTFKPMQPLQ
jgi:short-subunit dehydrogenase